MPKNVNPKRVEWERLTNILLYGLSTVRKLSRPDKSVTLRDDLIEIGATEQEARFLIRQAKRLDIETK